MTRFLIGWFVFGLILMCIDLIRPDSTIAYVRKQRGDGMAFVWATGILVGGIGLFVGLVLTPPSLIRCLPKFGPRS
jgi:hypothetical protein